ncbi:hypothetical protein EV426DRAFT_537042 [Tirmania nivea]|nr:hypothetical protein EV426DRAFT_537042 [Tirmania nivea]
MDEDNPLQRENDDPPPEAPPPAEGDDAVRIQELRILLERYPLYKPAHLEFIALLRRKYHALRTEEARSELESVRNFASETMQVGERGWLEWIEDEDKACHDLEGRLKVVDLCARAVEEQPMSAKLWKVYVDQLEGEYRKGVATERKNGSGEGDEMDEGLGEIFTWEMLIGVYAQAVEVIMDHIPESHLLWDRYIELLTEDLDAAYSESKLQQTRNALLTRLKTPHPNIDATFSAYSTLVTNYEDANYEKIMVSTNKIVAASKAKYDEREMHELQLHRAIEAVDECGSEENITAEWYAWKSYLDWELALPKKKMDVELAMALFERAVMRYDYRGEMMWEWYLDFLAEKANRSPRILPILERAVHAFPALPSLWSRYLVAMEARFKSVEDLEKVKNRAIDAVSKVGEEPLLEVCLAWAGVSKRRILTGSVEEEEREMLLEEVREYMKEFRNLDPEARLDRLYIAMCSQMQPPDVDSARKTWKGIVTHEVRAKSAKLWLLYYRWEFQWGTKAAAGAILRHACSKATTMDDAAAIFDAYMSYVTEWGDTTDVEEASWKLRKWKEKLPLAPVMATTAVTTQLVQAAPAVVVGDVQAATEAPLAAVAEECTPAKRRRSTAQEDEYPGSPPNKKSRPEHRILSSEGGPTRQAGDGGMAPKRDRENTTVIVRNLPLEIKDLRLRQFFRDCGKINSLKIVLETERKTATATIEFESLMDVLSAQTKDMRSIDGHEIEVHVGAGSTLYVTNFPPVAGEDYIRSLFQEFGEIADIRFPSLKYNTHRRFCYVQFLSADAAHKALTLHGKKLGPKEKLIVKISDPNAKQERSGPVYEGREVFLRNVDFKANEEMIREVIEREVGEVESVRLPSKVPGRHQGFGFVVFRRKEDAEKAAGECDGKIVVGEGERKLCIRLSEAKRPGVGTGQAVAVAGEGSREGMSPVAGEEVGDKQQSPPLPPSMDVIRKKTLAILNLPDTINDTRLREVFGKYGPLRKVQLRPEHGGAVVEFVEVKDAGKAELGLVGYKFGRGMEGMRFGRLEDLMKQEGVVKKEEEVGGKKKMKEKGEKKGGKEKETIAAPQPQQMFAPRNVVGVASPRGGMGAGRRRGGLGSVGGPLRRKEERVDGEGKKDAAADGDASATPAPKVKSNADFKAMYLKK